MVFKLQGVKNTDGNGCQRNRIFPQLVTARLPLPGKLQLARGISDAHEFCPPNCCCLCRVCPDSIHNLVQCLGYLSGLAQALSAKTEAVCPVGLPGSHGSPGGRCDVAFGHHGSCIPAFQSPCLPRGHSIVGKCICRLWRFAVPPGDNQYVAIKYSLRYETLVTTRRLTTAVATAWAFPVISTLIALTNAVVSNSVALAETILHALTLVGIPGSFAAICFCQVAVYLESRRHRRHIRAHQVSQAAAREILKKDKASRTTAMIVGAVLLCYAPVMVWSAVTSVAGFLMDVAIGAFCVMDVFTFGNSLINPIIYCVRT